MAERVQMIIKQVTFPDEERDNIVFSDATKIRLDPPTDTVQLKQGADGFYPLDLELNVRAPVQTAGAFRAFTGFQAVVKHERIEGVVVTNFRFRLWDGTNPVYWNGAAWVTATLSGHWNTEAEVAANIAAFTTPRTNGGTWGVYVNLQTTDRTVTPKLIGLKFGVNLKVHSWMEDILLRSLAQDLKAKLRPVTDFRWTMPATGNTIDIAAMIQTSGIPFNPAGVESAFNRTDDPGLVTDLFSSYNPGTKILTLSGSVASGKLVQVGLIYEPEVVINMTHQDFNEVEKVPCVIVNSIELVRAAPLQQGDYVLNKGTNVAKEVPPPYQGTLAFKIDLLTPGGIDLLRLSEAVMEYAENNPKLKSKASGESFRFWLKEEFSNDSRPGGSDVHTGRASAEICDVVFFKRAAVTGTGVDTVKLAGIEDHDIPTTGP